MTRGPAAALAAALVVLPAAANGERAFVLPAGGEKVRVVVPKLFEPLLPGSVYPNRRDPRAPRGAPVAVVERSLARRAEPFLLERGFVVAEVGRIDRNALEPLLAGLSRRLAVAKGAVILARSCADACVAPEVAAAALFEPDRIPAPPSSRRCEPIIVFRRTPDGAVPPSAPADAPCVSERWFRAPAELPDDAYRDAAEWLAALSRTPE